MTAHDKDKIISAANECHHLYSEWNIDIERFYAIAFEAGRQAEREACAKVCMQQCSVIEEPHEFERCAEAIRARGEWK